MAEFNPNERSRKKKPGRFNKRGSGEREGSFNRRGPSEREGSFNRRDRFSGTKSERPTMHEVTCDKCGERCEVPFKPTSSKPVYCSDCFRKVENSDSRPNRSGNELERINKKLDKILRALNID
ncbi:MAG: CxxC-x17-CxxC domain-containing protein [Nanoarchaeota archaeon]